VFVSFPSISLALGCITARGPILERLFLYTLTAAAWTAFALGVTRGFSIYRQVRATHGLACLRCLYTLAEDATRCPECGLDYRAEDVRRAWRSENVLFDSEPQARDQPSGDDGRGYG
jgi:RNA polymerase subunit RPABC4/transcription elongation factor Spt4